MESRAGEGWVVLDAYSSRLPGRSWGPSGPMGPMGKVASAFENATVQAFFG